MFLREYKREYWLEMGDTVTVTFCLTFFNMYLHGTFAKNSLKVPFSLRFCLAMR